MMRMKASPSDARLSMLGFHFLPLPALQDGRLAAFRLATGESCGEYCDGVRCNYRCICIYIYTYGSETKRKFHEP